MRPDVTRAQCAPMKCAHSAPPCNVFPLPHKWGDSEAKAETGPLPGLSPRAPSRGEEACPSGVPPHRRSQAHTHRVCFYIYSFYYMTFCNFIFDANPHTHRHTNTHTTQRPRSFNRGKCRNTCEAGVRRPRSASWHTRAEACAPGAACPRPPPPPAVTRVLSQSVPGVTCLV